MKDARETACRLNEVCKSKIAAIGRLLPTAIAFTPFLATMPSYAESAAYREGQRLASAQIEFFTVVFCMKKYEAWSDDDASRYLQSAFMSLSQKDRDSIRRINSRMPELRHPSSWQAGINKTLEAFGGCHNFMEQTGRTDLLMLLNNEEKYSDRPF
jgi:hypothetical protein